MTPYVAVLQGANTSSTKEWLEVTKGMHFTAALPSAQLVLSAEPIPLSSGKTVQSEYTPLDDEDEPQFGTHIRETIGAFRRVLNR